MKDLIVDVVFVILFVSIGMTMQHHFNIVKLCILGITWGFLIFSE